MEKDYKYKGLKRNNLLYLKANGRKKNIFPIFFIFLENNLDNDNKLSDLNNSLVVSIRKNVGNAVLRNRIRRRIRYIFQKMRIPGIFLCIINSVDKKQKEFPTPVDPYSFANLEHVIHKFHRNLLQTLKT